MGEHYQTDHAISQVRKYLQEGLSRSKILELMPGLSDRQLRSYTATIHEQDKKAWDSQANESLDSIALRIKTKYSNLEEVCDTIMNDPTKSPRDRIEAGKTAVACLNNIYNMTKDGPLRFNTVPVKELPKKEEKVSEQ